MANGPTEKGAAPLEKPRISKVTLAVGAATILYALISSIIWLARSAEAGRMLSAALLGQLPWAVAGIALTILSFRGVVRWARALATWVGGFLVGAPFLIIGVWIAGGPGDTTLLMLNAFFSPCSWSWAPCYYALDSSVLRNHKQSYNKS